MSSFIIIAAVGIFVASIVAFASSMLMATEETTATEDRLTQLASKKTGATEKKQSLLLVDESEGAGQLVKKLLENVPAVHKYLEQADIGISVMQFFGLCGIGFLFGFALCVISPLPILLGPIVGAAVGVLPFGYVLHKRKKRLAKFGQQIPEALELLGRSLRAGHSLQAGFGLVGEEMEPPLATEFKRCFEEQKFGIPLDESIEDMAERVPNMDIRFFATAVILQRQTGGDLSEILDKIGHLVRERLQILGQIQALTGEGRMSGAVLLALPPVLFLTMLKLNYEYVITLFTDPMGQYMLGAAIVTQILGALVIKKIITIKV
ncbi:type II secretion system F family protein [Neorhodopirellula pilleata]|uniref:Bacterial type II secretion system protein F domain protein n=1 Tax=Neorhodopirellula pilleata TaxID=2714738 RepID=A0A5C6ARQ0_9BACT|nr:type II secretion system F family protein [Neorhodopirellula pilleata]TWU01766.1 Bacterial type II secretion system protein F domain protein [Neorhodopirellula pilleata]